MVFKALPTMKKKTIRLLILIPVGFIVLFFTLIAAACFTADYMLTPGVSEKLIRKYAPVYFDGSIQLGRAEMSVFRHFPQLSLDIDSLVLAYPASHFDNSPQAADRVDTLASFRKFSASLNTLSLLRGIIKLNNVHLEHPRAFVHVFPDGRFNWEILKLYTADKTTVEQRRKNARQKRIYMPRMEFARMYVGGNPYLEYEDQLNDIHAQMTLKGYSFDGKLKTSALKRGNFTTSIDSLLIVGHMAGDSLHFDMDHFSVTGKNGHMDVDSRINTLMATRRFGRIMVPFSLKGKVDGRNNWRGRPYFHFRDVDVALATVNVKMDLELGINGVLDMEGNVTVPPVDIQRVLDDYLYNAVPQTRPVTTDMLFSTTVDVDGHYDPRSGELPSFTASVDIPESFIRHSQIDYIPRLELKTTLTGRQGGSVDASIAKCVVKGPQFFLEADGNLSDITGSDPLADMSCRVDGRLDSLGLVTSSFFDLFIGGNLKVDASGKFNLSNVSKYNFANADVNADVQISELVFKSYDDDLVATMDRLGVKASLMDFRFKEDSKSKDRCLGAMLEIDNLDLVYGKTAHITGDGISALFQNSSDKIEFSDTLRFHPLHVLLDIGRVAMKTGKGQLIGLEGSESRLVITPAKDNEYLPHYKISTENKNINADSNGLHARIKDLSLRADADKSKVHKRRFATIMDSLGKATPQFTADSMWRFLTMHPHAQKVPYFLGSGAPKAKGKKVDIADSLQAKLALWNVDAKLDVGGATVKDVIVSSLTTDFRIKDKCLQLKDLDLKSNSGNIRLDAFMEPRAKEGGFLMGAALDVKDVSAQNIISVVPDIDKVAPMMKSFVGKFNIDAAVVTDLDRNMHPVAKSMDGVLRLTGHKLHFKEDKTVSTIAKLLLIKNTGEGTIGDLDVEAMIRDGNLEVFPFEIKLDKWDMVLSARQSATNAFEYDISLNRSPIGVKLGAKVWGNDFKKIKFKLGKARYADKPVPSFSKEVEESIRNHTATIRNVFEVEAKGQDYLTKSLSFDPVYDAGSELDELTDSEKAVLEKFKK